MFNLKKFRKLVFVLFYCIVVISCAKEEKKVPLAQFTSPHYDVGFLTVKILNSPALIDSISYTNVTKGVTHTIDHSSMVYDVPNNKSTLGVVFASGHINDQVLCCVYINGPTSVGVAFQNITADSISTTFTTTNSYCQFGNY